VKAAAVVSFKVGPQPSLRLPAVAVGVQIYLLVLDRTPQPLDKDVVDPASFAIYAGAATGGLEDLEPVLTGRLRSLVSVEDFRRFEALFGDGACFARVWRESGDGGKSRAASWPSKCGDLS